MCPWLLNCKTAEWPNMPALTSERVHRTFGPRLVNIIFARRFARRPSTQRSKIHYGNSHWRAVTPLYRTNPPELKRAEYGDLRPNWLWKPSNRYDAPDLLRRQAGPPHRPRRRRFFCSRPIRPIYVYRTLQPQYTHAPFSPNITRTNNPVYYASPCRVIYTRCDSCIGALVGEKLGGNDMYTFKMFLAFSQKRPKHCTPCNTVWSFYQIL